MVVLWVLCAFVLIVVIIVLLSPTAGQRSPKRELDVPVPVPERSAQPISPGSTERQTPSSLIAAAADQSEDDASEEESEDAPLDAPSVKERIRVLEASGKTTQEALTAVIDELGGTEEIEEIVGVLNELRYTPCDLAPCLVANRYDLPAIIKLFFDPCEADIEDIIAALLPIADGANIQERARTVLQAIQAADEVDWNDGLYGTEPTECVEPLIENGVPADVVLTLLYEESDLRLGQCLDALPAAERPDFATIAHLVRDLKIDLTDEDECTSLRDDADYELQDILCLARIAVVPAEQAAELLDGFDDHTEALTAFLAAGYATAEAFKAFYDLDDVSAAEFVEAALNVPMPLESIIAFLNNERIDPEELDAELREETEIPFEQRIMLLAALLAKTPPEEPPREG